MNILLVKCYTCKELKPVEEYYKNSANKSGHAGSCKECVKKRVGIYNDNNKEQHLARAMKHQTQKRYGITMEEYINCMSTSDECQICSKKENLCYDHDHTTGKFRGVLCRSCNSAIGQLGDTKEKLKKAYEYLM